MKIFKYWSAEKSRINIYGEVKEITTYGGSNLSVEDAASKAREKVELVMRKIQGDPDVFEDYEVDIREEILRTLDEKIVITRNRYGAQVMNAENLLFLDIDRPKITLGGLFKRNTGSDKDKIFDMVRKLAISPKYTGLAFRLYETYQGARVIVTGRDFDARTLDTISLMSEFNTDPLYAVICRQQGCFRARLTPKPQRLKMKPYKVKFPREAADTQFDIWLQAYEQASRGYSVCRFIEQAGASLGTSEAVRYHDEISGAMINLPLA